MLKTKSTSTTPTIYFKNASLQLLDKAFGLQRADSVAVLEQWLESSQTQTITQRELIILEELRRLLDRRVDAWNEYELSMHFIGPLFNLIDFDSPNFNLYAGRGLKCVLNGIKMSGIPDGILAAGYDEPIQPYFCFQEYKRQTAPDSDPAGQLMAAMLTAQSLNENKKQPIYGCYMIGRLLVFMALDDKKYARSSGHLTTRTEDLQSVFKIFRQLKKIINQSFE